MRPEKSPSARSLPTPTYLAPHKHLAAARAMPQPAGHYVYAAFGWYEEPAIQKLAALTGIPADSAAIVRQRVDEWFCSSPASRDGIALPVADEVWHRVSGAPAAISPQAWRAACFEARILVTYRSWWRNPGMK